MLNKETVRQTEIEIKLVTHLGIQREVDTGERERKRQSEKIDRDIYLKIKLERERQTDRPTDKEKDTYIKVTREDKEIQ